MHGKTNTEKLLRRCQVAVEKRPRCESVEVVNARLLRSRADVSRIPRSMVRRVHRDHIVEARQATEELRVGEAGGGYGRSERKRSGRGRGSEDFVVLNAYVIRRS